MCATAMLLLSLSSSSSAFHSSRREPFAMLYRRDVRDTSTDFYRESTSSHPRQAPTTSRLQYSDGNEEDSSSTREPVWWNGLFTPQSDTINEQDSVDKYLEFLHKRYDRLHEEKEEENPLSAMNWLLQGSPKGEVLASKQQKEDALYVLGVAGLASQKLLQKHPQLVDAKQDSDIRVMSRPPAPIEALDTIVTSAEDVTFGHLVIKRVLVPFVKVLYFVHRQKQLFLDVQLSRAKGHATNLTKKVVRSLIYAPVRITKSIIDFGGGRASIGSTLALASAMFVLLRPLLQGLLSEGTV
ncbi:unnamed protein product [Cylindrotheca closterium]|uniref:Peroxisomal membrane protein PEX16 n=1 Tax=Cylindrotheca closterium TaxID=2856 RepID=A0AAD2JI42_9STRA|nr:unnamed protein product [Cylindrotheca closterium]